MRWLRGEDVVVVRDPDAQLSRPDGQFQFPGRAVAGLEDVREVERSPQRLVWWIENDTWARYVVHCCARYHNVVSFSTFHRFLSALSFLLRWILSDAHAIPLSGKDTPTHRLTHILRPNATRPDTAARAALATPPTTDGDFSSYDSDVPSLLSDIQSIHSGSDVLSESEFTPDMERRHGGEGALLSDIASDADADVETGSVQGGDGTVGGSGGDSDLEQATATLSLANEDEAPRWPLRGTAYRTRAGAMWDANRRARSGSSPSRSPARRQSRLRLGRATAKKSGNDDAGRTESFYDFLFK